MLRENSANWAKNLFSLLKIAIPTIGLGACIGLMGDALNGTVLLSQWMGVQSFSWPAWGRGFGVVLLATLVFAYWLYQKLPGELPLRSLSRPARPEPHPVLIFILSTPFPLCRVEDGAIIFFDKEEQETHRFAMTSEVLNDKEALRQLPRWNWQQQLHALALHRPRLERVYLIGSSGPGGSYAHLATFARLVRHYCGDIPVLWDEGPQGAVDFEDIEATYKQALRHIADAENAPEGYAQDEIIIDMTGGFKTASIAAGLVTLHNRVKFQYVNNSGEVVAYEMIYEPSHSLG